MNDLTHQFNLQRVAEKVLRDMRHETGLDAEARCLDGSTIVFTTDCTDTKTLKRFLEPELNDVAKAPRGEAPGVIDFLDSPDEAHTGSIAVKIDERVLAHFTYRFQ